MQHDKELASFAEDDSFGVTVVDSRAELASTLASPTAPPAQQVPAAAPAAPATSVRTTILPRIQRKGDMPVLVHPHALRYETVRPLGSGGVGEVDLVKDNDIDRQVALKRLRASSTSSQTPDAVIRFIEEIHTIGQLEHPGIVPIHDVGLDEAGNYYFIMKYAAGETLEGVIERLTAGDPAYLRRYPIEQRQRLFLQVLRAMEFAHARGFIHRDLKPANIMVGAYGEVVVMDWGLAKAVRRDAAAGPRPALPQKTAAPPEGAAVPRERLYTTQHGALLGTPAYMSPEQAAGDNDHLDERSDVYSLCVLFHELLTTRHYLAHHTTLHGMLYGTIHEPPAIQLGGGLPPEMFHFLRRGLQKDPAARFQSVAEMIAVLSAGLDGEIPVQCPFTGMRRAGGAFGHMVNARPFLALVAFLGTSALALYGGTNLVLRLLGS